MPSDKLPGNFTKLRKRHARLLSAADELGKAAKDGGPLDNKQALLIQLAAATAIHSELCTAIPGARCRQAFQPMRSITPYSPAPLASPP